MSSRRKQIDREELDWRFPSLALRKDQAGRHHRKLAFPKWNRWLLHAQGDSLHSHMVGVPVPWMRQHDQLCQFHCRECPSRPDE